MGSHRYWWAILDSAKPLAYLVVIHSWCSSHRLCNITAYYQNAYLLLRELPKMLELGYIFAFYSYTFDGGTGPYGYID